jgi:hypothetical protein
MIDEMFKGMIEDTTDAMLEMLAQNTVGDIS